MLEFHDTLFQDNCDFPLSCNMSRSSTLKLPPKCIIEKVSVHVQYCLLNRFKNAQVELYNGKRWFVFLL
jgi:hypothetical protein